MNTAAAPARIDPALWERCSPAVRTAPEATEDGKPGVLPLAEELLGALIHFGCIEPDLNGALALLRIDPEKLCDDLLELTFSADRPRDEPTLPARYQAFWRSIARIPRHIALDCNRLVERLLASDYLTEAGRKVAASHGLDGAILRRRALALDPELRIGIDPPLGMLLDAEDLPQLIGRSELADVVRERFAAGQHTLLWGPTGIGKRLLARVAATGSGRPVVQLNGADLSEVPVEQRHRELTNLASWLRLSGAGLLLSGVPDKTSLWPPQFKLDRQIPLLALSETARWPANLGTGRGGRKLRVPEPTAAETSQIMAQWASRRGRSSIMPAALDAAVAQATRHFGASGVPGVAANLLRRVELNTLQSDDASVLIDPWSVERATAEMLGLPLAVISPSERERLNTLADRLAARVVGQPEAIEVVVGAVRRRAVQLTTVRRPAGSFLFVGPTGVGKTELCRALAIELYGGEQALLQFDMGEYQEGHEISKLIGAPPGYKGYDEGSPLIRKLAENGEVVVLFDEIEKAHSDFYDLLLGMLDHGHLTGGDGTRADLTRALIVMTSNLGAKPSEWHTRGEIGFGARAVSAVERLKLARDAAVRDHFRREFLARLSGVVHFNPLTEAAMRQIVDLTLAAQIGAGVRGGLRIEVTPELRQYMTERAVATEIGGRGALAEVAAAVEDPLAEALLKNGHSPGTHYLFDLHAGVPRLRVRRGRRSA